MNYFYPVTTGNSVQSSDRGQHCRDSSIRLDSNESPFYPLPGVIESIVPEVQNLNRYPDVRSTELSYEVSRFLGIHESRVIVGPGSSVLCQQVIQECSLKNESSVVSPWYSFEAYPEFVKTAGARWIEVPLEDGYKINLQSVLDSIQDDTSLIILCNPNNPTGHAVEDSDIRWFLDSVPSSVTVLIDEAYREFVTPDRAIQSIDIANRYENVVLLRTFSKAYGLAGMRVGYCVARPDLATALGDSSIPYNVNTLAQRAAMASLDSLDELHKRVNATIYEREKLRSSLIEIGFDVPESQGNFLWLFLEERSKQFARHCMSLGISVKLVSREGVRVTVGGPHENALLLQAAKMFWT